MPYISKEHAIEVVSPYFDHLTAVVHMAWKDWMSSDIARNMQHKRVRANYVWNQLISRAKKVFYGERNVHIDSCANCDGILVDGSVFIRMKKAKPSLYSSNYPTQSALAFHDPIQDFFGGIARLELLYVLDSSETNIQRITLVQRYKSKIVWAIDLMTEVKGSANVVELPLQEEQKNSSSVAERLIKPIGGKENNGKQGGAES